MKSHTDVQQSKTLGDILPLDSADGTWKTFCIAGDALDIPENMQYVHSDMPFILFSGIGVPCWSLSALLDVLPSSTLDSSDDHHYRAYCRGRYTEWHDNAVDACYEIILKLHEQMIEDFNKEE